MTILVSGIAETSIAAKQAGTAYVTSTAAVATAFESAIPNVGAYVVAFCAFLFGLTTLTGWAYYGEQFLEYIFGRSVTLPYRWIYCLLIPFGAVIRPEVVWAWGDLMNALQVFPNLIGLIGLSGVVAAIARSKSSRVSV
jgi:AGCS family alanine or glycine:cation symporter